MSVLKNQCTISPAWDPSGNLPEPAAVEFGAIWDTGATHCVITQAAIDACGLAPTGMAEVHGVHGQALAETFLLNIGLPNQVVFHGVRVTKGILTGGADIIIGMSIINQGDFAVTNVSGKTVFSFRVPSVQVIDYVADGSKLQSEQSNTNPRNRAERRRAARGHS